ncbi:hypothetical protein AMK59_4360 [Oryctes borbonicus]|uniref:RAP domain-containing protein n=1 Tax=Oryctes borbonicus TaxID=1629725 RepID=A0A0T6B588_9SCAR|nr:hypothetical protein AMK59_4360 [Oryctes borbonicus]
MLKFTRIIQATKSAVNIQNLVRIHYSTASNVELKNIDPENGSVSTKTEPINKSRKQTPPFRNSMVAAAFASLEKETQTEIETPQTDKRIASATTINEILSISEGNTVSRKHALKVISVLADWSLQGKIKLPEFETDPRFIRLCKILTKTNGKQYKNGARSEDLSTILTITADDEAAKLVSSITLPQMVKVISTLAQKKRRSMILLRALSFNITKSNTSLDMKQCSDVLYGMAVLNFPDLNLLERVCIDACKGINDNLQKSAVLGSILTSLGLLKYKNNDLLEAACQWMEKYSHICRPQDIFALLITMAVLNYEPINADDFYKKVIPQVSAAETNKPSVWLDLVWSLALLNRATPELTSTVFSKEFINSLNNTQDEQSIAHKLKLLNIDSVVCYLTPDYQGANLDISPEIRDIQASRSREKEEMSSSLIECLKNLVSDKHIKTRINTKLGFYIDAECYFDAKCNPILPENYKKDSPDQKRIAVIALDYHDMCKGSTEPIGVNTLAIKLLTALGYQVLTIPYTEYRPKDKLVDRVKYLESKLKHLVQLLGIVFRVYESFQIVLYIRSGCCTNRIYEL